MYITDLHDSILLYFIIVFKHHCSADELMNGMSV